MPDDIDQAIRELEWYGRAAAERAFTKSLVNVEHVAKQIAPFGQYPVKHVSKKGLVRITKSKGGDLRASLRVEYLGASGDMLRARCVSDLPYARRQHEEAFYHPGMYSAPVAAVGPVYASAYFSRAVEIVFGMSGQDPLGDPSAWLDVRPPHFQTLVREEVNR